MVEKTCTKALHYVREFGGAIGAWQFAHHHLLGGDRQSSDSRWDS
jgi:hypothetical protein